MYLFYEQSADKWEESLPIGNGFLGGMIWGNVQDEIIGLNDDEFWSGFEQHFDNNRNEKKNLGEIKEKILNECYTEAQKQIAEEFLGPYSASYLPLGNLRLNFFGLDHYNGYKRKLDLDQGTVQVDFEFVNGIQHSRKAFASNPDKTIYFEIKQSDSNLNFEMFFETSWRHEIHYKDDGVFVNLKAPEYVAPIYIETDEPIIYGNKGIEKAYYFRISIKDGELEVKNNKVVINKSSHVEIAFSRYEDKNNLDFDQALLNHLSDYQDLYKRVDIDLGPQLDLATDKRLRQFDEDNFDDPGLIALYYQYNRYLLISSSRPNTFPANLQGIWNWIERAPWSSNWTTNINAQMNYWGADIANLSECFQPYSDFVERVTKNSLKTSEKYYGIDGAVIHHNTDRWYLSNPVGRNFYDKTGDSNSIHWSMWPMGGVWMSNDLFRHYLVTKDLQYLKETVYPTLREHTKFILGFLTEVDGVYHTIPSTSPENQFYDKKGDLSSLGISSTMDITLIHENFNFFMETCRILGIKDELQDRVFEVKGKLPKIKIGSKNQILEWQEEYLDFDPGHRHFSHLYGLFPGDLLRKNNLTEAENSILIRLENGGGHTGWSNAWLINFFAILGKGNKAFKHILHGLKNASYPNMWSSHPPFQIDGNFGNLAGLSNMFVHESLGELKILPALPDSLKNGYIKGLKTSKGIIEIYWQNGTLVDYKILEVKEGGTYESKCKEI